MNAGKSDKAVVLVSGGVDSATTLAIALRQGYACHALSFDYGQRHRQELDSAGRVARALGAVEHRVVRLDLSAAGGFGHSALTDDIAVPKDRPGRTASGGTGFQPVQAGQVENLSHQMPENLSHQVSENLSQHIPVTYVPARNTIFLAVALGYAEVIGSFDIFIGVNAVDYSGYPDCRSEFIEAFERTANLATAAAVEKRGRFRIHAPLIRLTKARIIRAGLDLGVDYSLTHSCYDPAPDGAACGRCDSCLIRLRGFAEAEAEDPARYARRQ